MTPAPTALTDDRDAWLDDVRRWYYGGNAPAADALPPPAACGPSAAVASGARADRRCCGPCRQLAEAAGGPGGKAAQPAS